VVGMSGFGSYRKEWLDVSFTRMDTGLVAWYLIIYLATEDEAGIRGAAFEFEQLPILGVLLRHQVESYDGQSVVLDSEALLAVIDPEYKTTLIPVEQVAADCEQRTWIGNLPTGETPTQENVTDCANHLRQRMWSRMQQRQRVAS
jgi:hypothetical protein